MRRIVEPFRGRFVDRRDLGLSENRDHAKFQSQSAFVKVYHPE
jgi:hypothetical protein